MFTRLNQDDAPSGDPVVQRARSNDRLPFVRGFGPGLVAGASANDPTTVGSLAVVGAATGYGLGWLVLATLPMLALVQTIAASIAAVSQASLQQAIMQTYGRLPALLAAAAIVSIDLFTLGADVQAGSHALTLLLGVPWYLFTIPIVAIAGWLLATKSYLHIERTLACFTLIFLCYVASAILARPNWSEVLQSIVAPRFAVTPPFAAGAVALLGTTLTGYVYFWESIEVAERRPRPSHLRAINADAAIGMLVSGFSFIFILIATAAMSEKQHLSIATAADAAIALKPLAGPAATALFGLALFASAAIAIPIIAATNGYVLAQTFGTPASLTCDPREAPFFFRCIYVSLAIGAVLAFVPVSTMALLYAASIAAGLATPLTLALMMLLARNRRLMRGRPIGLPMACAGWGVTAIVTLASAVFIVAGFAR